MALCQVVPKFNLNLERFGKDDPIPRGRSPVEVVFRSGAEMTGVVNAIRTNRVVAVDAAPGAGKSTVLPAALAASCSGLVVHVFPFETMAYSAHRYLSRGQLQVSLTYMSDPSQGFPERGLVLVSAGTLIAHWLTLGRVELPACYLLHDESHESGFATGLLRKFGPCMAGVLSYVTMSATAKPGKSRKMETPGSVEEQFYDPDAFEDPWSVESGSAPWSVDVLDYNVLIFEDDAKRAADLIQAYNYNGLRAFRLSARMTVREFAAVLDSIEDPHSASLCVLVADSTFRSGYTFPVGVIVDSGHVCRVVVSPGGAVQVTRRELYGFEVVQSRARGGRMSGQHTVYWRPKTTPKEVVCDLEQTDVEALALVCRLLGYRPPSEAASAVLASGPVPLNVCEALRAPTPLASLSPHLLGDRPEAALPVAHERSVTPVARAPVDGRRVSRAAEAPVASFGAASGAWDEARDVVSAMMDGLGVEQDEVVFGAYYCAVDVPTTAVSSFEFPDGAASVKRVAASDKSGTFVKYMQPHSRAIALNAVLHEYNSNLLCWRSCLHAVAEVKTSKERKAPHFVREWARAMAERVSALAMVMGPSLQLAVQLAEGFSTLQDCSRALEEEELKLTMSYCASYDRIPAVDAGAVAAEQGRVRDHGREAVAASEAMARDVVQELGYGVAQAPKSVRARVPGMVRWFSGYPKSTIRVTLDGGGGHRRRTSSSGSSSGSRGRVETLPSSPVGGVGSLGGIPAFSGLPAFKPPDFGYG